MDLSRSTASEKKTPHHRHGDEDGGIASKDGETDKMAVESQGSEELAVEATPKEEAVSTAEPAEDDFPDFDRPKGLSLFLIFLGLCLALLCVSLDRTIVATAVPRITSDFNSLDDAAWYGSAYLFATCAVQLLFGKLYTRADIKLTFLASLALFEVGSVVCGAAPNSTALILGRAVAGVGCAGLTAGALIIAALCVETKDRPKYLGIVSAVMGIAFIASPTLGGALTENATWRWCFYINLPLGAVTFGAVAFLLKLPPPAKPSTFREHIKHLDLPGTLIFIPAVVSLLLALQWAGTEYAWSNWRIILLLCVFGVMIAVWVALQVRRGDLATIPPRIISQRSIYIALYYMTVIGAATFIVSYFVPIWFQAVKNYSPQGSGINYLSVSIPGALFALVSGVLTSRIGYYVPSMYIGTVAFSVGAGLLYRLGIDTGTGQWLGTLIVIGLGIGFSFQVGLITAQTVLKGNDISIGTSVMVQGQTLGGAIFLCVAQNVFQNRLLSELAERAPLVNPAMVVLSGASQLKSAMEKVYPQFVDEILESYNESLKLVWVVVIVLVCVSTFGMVTMPWTNVKTSTKADKVEKA